MDTIGKLPIKLIRGNTKTYGLSFFNELIDLTQEPIDLTEYDSIRMDVKKTKRVDASVFKSYGLGTGLTIFGQNNNILKIDFGRNFTTINDTAFDYDILFEKDGVFQTLISGNINITPVVTL
jgi:hypothetical protein